MKEARINLKEAIKLILETNRELALKGIAAEERIKEPIFISTGK